MGYLNHMLSSSSRASLSDSESDYESDEESVSVTRKKQNKPVQCVCFDMKPAVMFIESILDMSDEDVENTWYLPDEMTIMIQKAKACLEGRNPEDDTRGLEHCTPEGARRRKAEQGSASEAVLGEQLRQQAAKATENQDFDDGDELIAIEYRKVNQHNRQKAQQRALDDEREVTGRLMRRPMLALSGFGMSARTLMGSVRNLVTA